MIGIINNDKKVCPWWLAFTFDNPIRRLIHDPKKIFGSYVKKGMNVADIGCGIGYFSIALAKLVGDSGCVYSIDLQQKMLNTLYSRAQKLGVNHIIRLHKVEKDSLNFHNEVDFALTFWMLHEVPDPFEKLKQIYSILKPNGIYCLVEPKIHVPNSIINELSKLPIKCGFTKISEPKIALSHSFIYKKVA
ncbi:MAG: class I SAM-dependent methyltransferase [Desulfobacterales bacterium]|nr:class I SAM-dependent methyltransferase [Desulfobacterales bacterium]